MKKAQEELDDVVGVNNIVEESHLLKLHYLDVVVKETLRLHPAAPLLIPHCPSLSCMVGGYTIPKGISLAESMKMYILASLLHSFQWQLPKSTELDLSEKFGTVLKIKVPLVAIATPRLSDLELYA
ncbi:hypothetical protein HHK36_000356 [Tetracentron sinense]|uniref:Cytochrome P450 n=1 Tax=Tetracentron sinense TaxID=13715 RepID=A0A834ZTY8_TETSI|nr:hypothetical protein HHK36_000356 [Tetracentron sinense]